MRLTPLLLTALSIAASQVAAGAQSQSTTSYLAFLDKYRLEHPSLTPHELSTLSLAGSFVNHPGEINESQLRKEVTDVFGEEEGLYILNPRYGKGSGAGERKKRSECGCSTESDYCLANEKCSGKCSEKTKDGTRRYLSFLAQYTLNHPDLSPEQDATINKAAHFAENYEQTTLEDESELRSELVELFGEKDGLYVLTSKKEESKGGKKNVQDVICLCSVSFAGDDCKLGYTCDYGGCDEESNGGCGPLLKYPQYRSYASLDSRTSGLAGVEPDARGTGKDPEGRMSSAHSPNTESA
ncbi:hypothetical protein FQN54_005425 [Arachnomyces sp. PD_36]|nr:hypothetical protein FQN54_005425 [Arachnomyces sp. PD_36]